MIMVKGMKLGALGAPFHMVPLLVPQRINSSSRPKPVRPKPGFYIYMLLDVFYIYIYVFFAGKSSPGLWPQDQVSEILVL